jgi:hypothetical protein
MPAGAHNGSWDPGSPFVSTCTGHNVTLLLPRCGFPPQAGNPSLHKGPASTSSAERCYFLSYKLTSLIAPFVRVCSSVLASAHLHRSPSRDAIHPSRDPSFSRPAPHCHLVGRQSRRSTKRRTHRSRRVSIAQEIPDRISVPIGCKHPPTCHHARFASCPITLRKGQACPVGRVRVSFRALPTLPVCLHTLCHCASSARIGIFPTQSLPDAVSSGQSCLEEWRLATNIALCPFACHTSHHTCLLFEHCKRDVFFITASGLSADNGGANEHRAPYRSPFPIGD